ncbi:MAG TPA: phosphoribosylpyrophosphate synthetase [Bacteroidia bacterium]|nr:phosphoribosylpyrophosphate synthetase [Bacteroidia bacterium]
MKNYHSLLEAIDGLRAEGYTEDFNLLQNCIECREKAYKIFHDEFVVDKYLRFEEDTNPADQSTIYAISSEKYGLKGILVNGYGIYSDPITDEMLNTLQIK